MRAWLGVAVLVVRVYDTSGTADVDRQTALDVARQALSAAGVHVIFKQCVPAAPNRGPCSEPLIEGERMVRIMNAGAEPAPRTEGWLGTALVDTVSKTGVLTTAFADRIARVSAGQMDQQLLLGRVIAHELGHLLLGVRKHSDSGLMRELWTDEQVRRNKRVDWAFSPDDRQQICLNLLASPSVCGASRTSNSP
jgi:hypothetical protein